ncbi:unnamed protein product, partial [Oikopleura dioica]
QLLTDEEVLTKETNLCILCTKSSVSWSPLIKYKLRNIFWMSTQLSIRSERPFTAGAMAVMRLRMFSDTTLKILLNVELR